MDDFNPDQYLSEKTQDQSFDPDKYLSEKAPVQEPEELTTPQAYAIKAAKGLTAGLTGVAAGLGAAAGTFAGGKKSAEELKKAYQEALEINRKREEAAAQKTGLLGTGVEIAASIPSLVVGGGALKGLGMASKIGQGATLGAGAGLSQYLGQTPSPTLGGAALSTGVGTGLGAVGGKIGGALESKLAPEALDVSSSKMAQEAMGMNSAKDLMSRFNPMTGVSERGSDIIKGTGTTAMEQGVLKGGRSNWYDNAVEALQKNYSDLNPVLESTQQKLNPNISNIINEVGPIGTKIPDAVQSVFDEVPQNSQRNLIVKKISQQYSVYEQKLAQADGNLNALNDIKKELTTAAQNLSPQVYTNGTAKAEADLYKRMGGIVRQHIEDLSNSADSGAGDQIHQINNNIGRLTEMLPSLQKTTRGGLPTSKSEIVSSVVGPMESLAAKGLRATSKVIQTPAGELAQKAAVNLPLATVTSPFAQKVGKGIAGAVGDYIGKEGTANAAEFSSAPSKGTAKATQLSSSLYNATDDSLKNVSSTLKQTPGLEFYADHLNKAIDENNDSEKNRAIFLILQNPKARKLVTPNNELKMEQEKALNRNISKQQ